MRCDKDLHILICPVSIYHLSASLYNSASSSFKLRCRGSYTNIYKWQQMQDKYTFRPYSTLTLNKGLPKDLVCTSTYHVATVIKNVFSFFAQGKEKTKTVLFALFFSRFWRVHSFNACLFLFCFNIQLLPSDDNLGFQK